jgi:hypothetical protein
MSGALGLIVNLLLVLIQAQNKTPKKLFFWQARNNLSAENVNFRRLNPRFLFLY